MPVVIVILIFVIYLAFTGVAYLFKNPGVAFWIAAVIGGIVFLRKRHQAEQARLAAIAAEQRDRAARIAEEKRQKEAAERLRQSQLATLAGIGANSRQLVKQLHDLVWQSEEQVARAEAEFRERAFGPFWDAIEAAAYKLAMFETVAASVRNDAETHRKTVSQMTAPVPAYPVVTTQLPQITRSIERLNAAVRLAQRDFEFSNIYEHRKTNRLLVNGFSTLGTALTELGDKLDSSMRELHTSIRQSVRATEQLSNRVDELGRRQEPARR